MCSIWQIKRGPRARCIKDSTSSRRRLSLDFEREKFSIFYRQLDGKGKTCVDQTPLGMIECNVKTSRIGERRLMLKNN